MHGIHIKILLKFVSSCPKKDNSQRKNSVIQVNGRFGQLLQKKISDASQIGAMFELGSHQKQAKIGAHYTYSVNNYMDVGLSGDISQLKNLGASVWINLNINVKNLLLKPFVNIDHKTLAEAGIISYFKVNGVDFNVGISFAPKVLKRKNQKIALLFGTSFSEDSIFDKLVGKSD